MILTGQTVGGLGVYCIDAFTTIKLQAGIVYLSFKTTVGDVDWSETVRGLAVYCMRSPHVIKLQGGHIHHSKLQCANGQ